MTDYATLGFKADTSGLKKAQSELQATARDGKKTEAALTKAAENTAQSFGGLSSAIKIAGGALAAMGVGISVNQAVQSIAQFESSLNSLRSISGATTDQMKALESQARSLGATSIYSAQQAADAQAFLAQAGFDVNEIIRSTPSIMALATAGNLDLARAADIASNALGGMQMDVSELTRLTDVMAATASSTNTNIEQMGQALSYAAPVAQSAGVSIEELSAAIGVLGDSGLQSSRAGTAMIGMIRQLSNATPEAKTLLAGYGLTMADVDIKANGLTNVLQSLRNANISTADAFKIFGSEVAPAFNILAAGSNRVKELEAQLKSASGAADAMAKIMGQGLANAANSLSSAIGEAVLQINDSTGLGAGLTSLTLSAAGLINVWNGLGREFAEANDYTEEQFESLESLAGAVKFTATAAAAAGGAYMAYRGALAAATVAQLAFNAAARANPVGLAVTAIGALAAAMIHVSQSAKRSADELDRVSAKAREYRTLVDTVGTAERAQRAESLKSEIERLERMNDINFLLGQRAIHFERVSALEKQGYTAQAEAHKRIVDDLNKRIANTDNLSERIAEMRKELEQLTGEQDENTESLNENTEEVAAAVTEADKMIERLEREVALYGMTNEQQARYNILTAGGTEAQAERAAAMQTWIDKQDEAATATSRLNDITQQQRDLQMQNMGAMAQEVARYSQTLQTIEQLRADDLISHQEYLQAKHEAELAHASQVKSIEQDIAASRSESMKGTLGAMSQAFGNMAEIAKAGGKDQFDTWKAMATAQALVSTSLAIVNALTAGPIMGPILAGTIGALGAVQVAQIQAQEYQGSYLGGGYTGSGSRTGGLDGAGGFPAILHPNETVIDHTKGQSIGGTVVNVTPVFNIQGGGDDVRSQIMEALPMITQSVMGAVERAAGRGGSMSRAVGRR